MQRNDIQKSKPIFIKGPTFLIKTAWDMDGVFLDDIETALYLKNEELAYVKRYQQNKSLHAPVVDKEDVIITSRGNKDEERTLLWAAQQEIYIPVIMRGEYDDPDNYDDRVVAKWKGKMALTLGFEHYVESTLEQSIHMAELYPELRVTWWNEGCPINIEETEHWMTKGA